jgi:ribonuclease Z
MMKHLDLAFQFDIRIRLYDDRTPPQGVVVLAEDIGEGLVYEKNGVKVTAIEVDHSPIDPAFGYRIDYAGRSVVSLEILGIQNTWPPVPRGVDVIIHEVIAANLLRMASPNNPEVMEPVIAHNTSPEQAGEVFDLTTVILR